MNYDSLAFEQRLKELYPAVDENLNPLPKKWSTRERYAHLHLQDDGLRVSYAGQGKNHKDAGSVRATNPIPAACGLYYFEVKVISKGRDGYMGIGLSGQSTNLNRLPGWEKLTYGYHGDDGHKFFSTGNGQPYGPTFTTGDIVGCCYNLLERTCFYTKNGIVIGDAFNNLPQIPLYPTVGLQTPNEELLAKFGQHEFMFNFRDYLKEWRKRVSEEINTEFTQDEQSHQMNQLVQSYLIHHGYVGSIEAFHKSAGADLANQESLTSMKSRQRIKQLILAGKIGEAIECTDQLFPGLLSSNTTLLFTLKLRQFIEMINGTSSEVQGLCGDWNDNCKSSKGSSDTNSKGLQTNKQNNDHISLSEPMHAENIKPHSGNQDCLSDNDMETDDMTEHTNGVTNGFSENSSKVSNGVGDCNNRNLNSQNLCGGNPEAVKQMVEFGQHLRDLLKDIKSKSLYLKNKRLLMEAYSLLAYVDPMNCPVGYQLLPNQREPVFASLNSSILESQNLPTRPPIQTLIGHTRLCLKKMLQSKIGKAAFVSVSDYLS